MALRLRQVALREIALQLHEPFRLSSGVVSHRRIVFVEVKTAGADLSTRERRVRDAVRARQVEWSELRVAPGPA